MKIWPNVVLGKTVCKFFTKWSLVKGVLRRNLQHITFIWTYWQISKSALAYLWIYSFKIFENNFFSVLIREKPGKFKFSFSAMLKWVQKIAHFRRGRSRMFFKTGVLKSFAIFTGKHLRWSLFLISCNFITAAVIFIL